MRKTIIFVACVYMIMILVGDKMKEKEFSVLGAGFACLDIVKLAESDRIMLGGTAANVVSFLSFLGIGSEFLLADYSGESGDWLRNSFEKRGVKCIRFSKTRSIAPRVIETFDEDTHIFFTECPKCGRSLIKVCLPSHANCLAIDEIVEAEPNVFFFDRMSDGIRYIARKNRKGWNVYEPNSCRAYSGLFRSVMEADIIKYSESRVPERITQRLYADLPDTDAVLLIVTLGDQGLKYAYRETESRFSKWNYITPLSAKSVVDSSGAGDWLTAMFLYRLLRRYPYYVKRVNGQYIDKILSESQKYALRSCRYIGAQGMLKSDEEVKQINCELNLNLEKICDLHIDWESNCEYCYCE